MYSQNPGGIPRILGVSPGIPGYSWIPGVFQESWQDCGIVQVELGFPQSYLYIPNPAGIFQKSRNSTKNWEIPNLGNYSENLGNLPGIEKFEKIRENDKTGQIPDFEKIREIPILHINSSWRTSKPGGYGIRPGPSIWPKPLGYRALGPITKMGLPNGERNLSRARDKLI